MGTHSGESHPASDVDSVCDKFGAAWKEGERPCLEEYLNRASPNTRVDLLIKLIQIELWWRRAESPPPSVDSFTDRFPEFAEGVDAAFAKFQQEPTDPSLAAGVGQACNGSLIDTVSEPADDPSTLVPESNSPNRPNDWGLPEGIEQPQKIGRYMIVKQLGRGGQGAVYRAVHPNLPIELAIKISVKRLDAEHQRALKDEAQILCDLDHPNIARVRDLDFYQGRPFLVLEFIRGRSLRERLATGEIPTGQSVAWLANVARAIDFAHRRGVVHLDLKPDNIVIDENDEPKVIDFGLARMRDVWNNSAVEDDGVSGTLQYMAPEQAEGKAKRIGAHSDIFALGAILYHIIVGKTPFEGRNLREMLEAIRRADFDRQAIEDSQARPEWKAACLKAMSLEPAQRFGSAAEFADAIELSSSATDKSVSSTFRLLAICVAIAATTAALVLMFQASSDNDAVMTTDGNASIRIDSASGSMVDRSPLADSLVQQFTITHIGNTEEGAEFSMPLFSEREPLEQDDVEVEAQFSEPAYCFLLALNPDGDIQLCYPESETIVQSGPITRLRFPPDEDLAFGLTDGAGHQAFILVTSKHPPPAFVEWKSSLSAIPWPDQAVTGDWVYAHGELIPRKFAGENFDATGTRGDIRRKQQPTALKGFLDSINESGDMEVEGVVFEVHGRSLKLSKQEH